MLRSLLISSASVAAIAIAPPLALAGGPTGGQVVGGSADISTSGNSTLIEQSSQKAIINWQDFSIPAGSSVTFDQPGASAIALNRVIGPSQSLIDGTLTANGRIWIINANGVMFGAGSQVNVGSLFVTTADIDNGDFMSGNYAFDKASKNQDAAIVNDGSLRAAKGGSIVLAGPVVENNGLIEANLGSVTLAAGRTFAVDFQGDKLIQFAITKGDGKTPVDKDGKARKALVSNTGKIAADGGRIVMTARAAKSVADNVINTSGIIEATSVHKVGGTIVLDAGPNGEADVSGTIAATGLKTGQKGGSVSISGHSVKIADGTTINASGDAGGGTVAIGGDVHGQGDTRQASTVDVGDATIKADAVTKGDGGTISVWSKDQTNFAGSASAQGGANGGNGGLVETSGHALNVASTATVDTSAPLGLTGTWLLDPSTISIETGGGSDLTGSSIDPSAIISNLDLTNVMLEATSTITVYDPIVYNKSNSLSLLSEGNIYVGADIQNSGSGDVNLVAGWDGHTTDATMFGDAGVFGNNGGSVYVTSDIDLDYPDSSYDTEASEEELENETADVAVGSALGTTRVSGYDVNVYGYYGASQIGYRGAASGAIAVNAVNNVNLVGSEVSGCPDCYAQIGNGGIELSGDESGAITVNAGGDVSLSAGAADYAYAQIGNGGDSSTGTDSGDISVSADGSVVLTGDSDYAQIGNGGWSEAGTKSGTINVTAGGDLSLTGGGSAEWGYAQIGNGGQAATGSSSGDITVSVTGGLSLTGGTTEGAYVQIGNGSASNFGGDDPVSLTTGNIAVTTDGTLTLAGSTSGAGPWIGNVDGMGNPTSGNVAIVAQDIDDTGSINSFSSIIEADLGSDTTGGDVTVGLTGGTLGINDGITYVSPHTLSILSTGDITITGTLQNSGTGAINLVAGWDGTTLDSAHFGDAGVFAHDGAGTILLGGSDAEGNAAIGTGGTLSVYTEDLTLSATNGNAQLGYHGASSGDIIVNANGALSLTTTGHAAQIGNGGPDVSGDAGGDITVNAASIGLTASGDYGVAAIGNIGGGETGSQSGTIIINDAGDLAMTSDGYYSAAQIGNWSVTSTSGSATGDITVDAGGALSLSAVGDTAEADIGNGGYFTNTDVGGDITVTSASLSLLAQGAEGAPDEARIANRGTGDVSGNYDVETTSGDMTIKATAGGLASIGTGSDGGGNVSGNIKVVSAGKLAITAIDTGEARISSGFAPDSNIDVTATGDITLSTSGSGTAENPGFALIGNFGNYGSDTGGDIHVTSTGGSISLLSDADYGLAAIGNGSGASSTSGNVTVEALDATNGAITLSATGTSALAQIGNVSGQGVISGDLTVSAGAGLSLDGSGTDAMAVIGNGGMNGNSGGGNVGGDIAITAGGALTLTGSGQFWIGNIADGGYDASGNVSIVANAIDGPSGTGGFSNIVATDLGTSSATGGDVTVGITGDDITIDNAVSYSSPHTLSILTTGDLIFTSSLQNSGSGTINLVAGWDGATLDPAHFADAGVFAHGGAGAILIGGSDAEGNAAVGTAGTLNVYTEDLTLDAVNGTAQLGYNGTSSGKIAVDAAGTLTMTGSSPSQVAFIGNGSSPGIGGGIVDLTVASISLNANNAIVGQSVTLAVSGSGDVGAAATPLQIWANSLALTTAGGDAFLSAPGGALSVGVAGTGIDLSGGALTLTASGALTQTAAINAGALTVSSTGGTITLTNADNSFGTLGVATSGSNDADVADSVAVAVSGAGVGGTFTLTSGGAITQSGAINANALNVTATGGAITLNNLANAFASLTLDAGSDAATVYDTADLAVNGLTADGGLTLLSTGDLIFNSSVQIADGTLLAVAGWDGTSTSHASLTSDSAYGNNGGSIIIGGSGASGDVAVGASGAATLAAANVTLDAAHGYAQFGMNGSGSGSLTVLATGDVALDAGTGTGDFAQIGNGGYQTSGDNSGDITVTAGGDLDLAGGSGTDAYAQIGNGGGKSNANSSGYSETGSITVSAANANLTGGTGNGAYTQLGNGGLRIGDGLTGTAKMSGDLTLTVDNTVDLTGGNGKDAYAQIGNGGDQSNKNAGTSAKGTISGDITVTAPTGSAGAVNLLAGSGLDAYAQIGNGGYAVNAGTTPANFTISGDVTVTDLLLQGGNDSANAYSQVGNGDASLTGVGDVSGDIYIDTGSGTVTVTSGSAQGSGATISNATGSGTVSGTITGYTPPSTVDNGVVAVLTDTTVQTTTTPPPDTEDLLTVETGTQGGSETGTASQGGSTPLEDLMGGDTGESKNKSDKAADALGKSLDGAKKKATTQVFFGGLLKHTLPVAPSNRPHGVPPADANYSSWGNEAFWE